jgi:hypothetical protein
MIGEGAVAFTMHLERGKHQEQSNSRVRTKRVFSLDAEPGIVVNHTALDQPFRQLIRIKHRLYSLTPQIPRPPQTPTHSPPDPVNGL